MARAALAVGVEWVLVKTPGEICYALWLVSGPQTGCDGGWCTTRLLQAEVWLLGGILGGWGE